MSKTSTGQHAPLSTKRGTDINWFLCMCRGEGNKCEKSQRTSPCLLGWNGPPAKSRSWVWALIWDSSECTQHTPPLKILIVSHVAACVRWWPKSRSQSGVEKSEKVYHDARAVGALSSSTDSPWPHKYMNYLHLPIWVGAQNWWQFGLKVLKTWIEFEAFQFLSNCGPWWGSKLPGLWRSPCKVGT